MAPSREPAFRRAFGRAVRAAREERGLTQRAVAERAGIAEKYLSRIEVGASTPSIFVAVRLGEALEIGLDKLLRLRPRREDDRFLPALAVLRRLRGHELERAIAILEVLATTTR